MALSVELGDDISVETNTRVRALEFLIQQKGLEGVAETVPSFRSLLVYYDPGRVGYDTLCASLGALAEQASTAVLPPARLVELPCCYDPELGLDLEAAAQRLGLTRDELIRLHSSAEFGRSVRNMWPGLCVSMNDGLLARATACGVTPHAQNTGTSPGANSWASPQSGRARSRIPSALGSPMCTGAP